MDYLAKQIDHGKTEWIAKERCGRCMEHSINCATRAFVEAVAPTPVHKIKAVLAKQHRKKKGKGKEKVLPEPTSRSRTTTFEDDTEDNAEDNDKFDNIDVEALMDELDGIDPMDDNKLNDFETSFNPKDLLGKVLAFVNQVRASPQARTYFSELCTKENVQPLQLLKWVRTRWASLYDLLHRLFVVRKVSGPLS